MASLAIRPRPGRPKGSLTQRKRSLSGCKKRDQLGARRHHNATMIALSVCLAAFLTPPAGVRVAKETDRRCAVLLKIGPDSKGIDAEISLAAKVDERWKFLRDNPGAEAAEAADNSKANPMQRSKDARLAERDTRRWCLDRCLSTGYCEVRLHMDPPRTLPRGWFGLEYVLGLEFCRSGHETESHVATRSPAVHRRSRTFGNLARNR